MRCFASYLAATPAVPAHRPLRHAFTIAKPPSRGQSGNLTASERDGQAIFDALGAPEKELLWIEESNQRFYAYNHFGQHPERQIGWFDRYMPGRARE